MSWVWLWLGFNVGFVVGAWWATRDARLERMLFDLIDRIDDQARDSR